MTHIFANHGLTLHEFGLAVLPTTGKKPLVGGFSNWRRPPSKQAVVEWQQKFPDANVGYHAGHSGLVIVDIDEADAIDDCFKIFGATPGRVRTRRGEHALYRAPPAPLPNGADLRAHGLSADLKYGFGGQSIVIAPPSQHPDGGDYSWLGCDPGVLTELPTFDLASRPVFIAIEIGTETVGA